MQLSPLSLRGNAERRKKLSLGEVPNLSHFCTTGVNDACGGHRTPHTTSTSCTCYNRLRTTREHAPLRYGCLHVRIHLRSHAHIRPIPSDLFFSCRASHFCICTYSHAHCGLPTGSGESGKSTIVKQMKIIHQNGYSREELLAFRPLIWKNLLESGRDVVQALAKFNLQPISPSNKVR